MNQKAEILNPDTDISTILAVINQESAFAVHAVMNQSIYPVMDDVITTALLDNNLPQVIDTMSVSSSFVLSQGQLSVAGLVSQYSAIDTTLDASLMASAPSISATAEVAIKWIFSKTPIYVLFWAAKKALKVVRIIRKFVLSYISKLAESLYRQTFPRILLN